jgi:hypothetical protein
MGSGSPKTCPNLSRHTQVAENEKVGVEQTTKLISTRSEKNTNQLLGAGWTLLSIADRSEGEHQWLHYQFGWQHESEPPEM